MFKKSVTTSYFRYSVGFGILIAVIFRIVTPFFVNFKSGIHDAVFSAMCVISGVIVGIFSYLIGKVTIIKTLGTIGQTAEKLKHGDLTSVISLVSDDVFGNFSATINDIIIKMRKTIEEMTAISFKLATAMNEQSNAATALSDNASNLAGMQGIIIESSARNVASIDDLSFNVDILSNMSSILMTRVNNLSDIIISSGQDSRNAINAAGQVSGHVKLVEKSLKAASDIMQEIENSSNEMTDIMNMINDIADRINLLSLNASIESARAGEAGRGFAVVAQEISKLADQTGASIKNIDMLIKTNNSAIRNGISSIDETVSTMAKTITTINCVINTINTMYDNMQKQVRDNDDLRRETSSVQIMTDDISRLFEDFRLATEDINESLAEIGNIGSSNAAASEELSATSDEIYHMSGKLNDLVKIFRV